MDSLFDAANIEPQTIALNDDGEVCAKQYINPDTIPLNKNSYLLDKLYEKAVADDLNKFRTVDYLTNVTKIPQKLSPAEQSLLHGTKSAFNLTFTQTMEHPHAFAAAHRIIETVELYHLVGHNFNVNHDQIRVIDIGGDFVGNCKRGATGIHHCSPIIDTVDKNRFTNRSVKLEMWNYDCKNKSIISENSYQQYRSVMRKEREVTDFMCARKFQNCNVQARFCISVHSLYDIKIVDLVDGMDKHGCVSCVATMMYDPKMLSLREGILDHLRMRWVIEKPKNSAKTITFHFLDSPTIAYVHDLATYISWFTITTTISSLGNEFVIEPILHSFGVYYLRINKVAGLDNIPRTPVRVIWNTGLQGKMRLKWKIHGVEELRYLLGSDELQQLRGYVANGTCDLGSLESYDRLMESSICNVPNTDIYEISFLFDADLLKDVEGFVLSTAEKKFNPIEVFGYMRSRISGIAVGKEIISTNKNIDPRLLYIASQVLYIYIWAFKYYGGKNMQINMACMIANRGLAGSGFFARLWLLLKRNRIMNYVRFLCKNIDVATYNRLKIPGMELEDFICTPPLFVDMSSCCEDALSWYNSRKNPDNDTKLIVPALSHFDSDPGLLLDVLKTAFPGSFKLVTDANDAYNLDVIYRSDSVKFMELGLVVSLANLVYDKKKRYIVKNYFKNIMYGYHSVCLVYQPNNIIDSLIKFLVENLPVSSIELKHIVGKTYLEIEFGDSYNLIDDLIYLEDLYVRSNEFNVSNFNIVTVPVCRGGGCDRIPFITEINRLKKYNIQSSVVPLFNSNAMTKLYQLDELLDFNLTKLLPGTTVLDLCAGPGAMSKYIIESNADKFSNADTANLLISCSLASNGPMTDSYIHPRRLVYERLFPDFNIIDTDKTKNFIDFVRIKMTRDGVELIVADGGISGEFVDQERRSIPIILAEICIALELLARGGRLVMKIYFGETSEMIQLISCLSTYFVCSNLHKPKNSNKANGEIYFVGLNFRGKKRSENFHDEVRKYRIGLQSAALTFNTDRYNFLLKSVTEQQKELLVSDENIGPIKKPKVTPITPRIRPRFSICKYLRSKVDKVNCLVRLYLLNRYKKTAVKGLVIDWDRVDVSFAKQVIKNKRLTLKEKQDLLSNVCLKCQSFSCGRCFYCFKSPEIVNLIAIPYSDSLIRSHTISLRKLQDKHNFFKRKLPKFYCANESDVASEIIECREVSPSEWCGAFGKPVNNSVIKSCSVSNKSSLEYITANESVNSSSLKNSVVLSSIIQQNLQQDNSWQKVLRWLGPKETVGEEQKIFAKMKISTSPVNQTLLNAVEEAFSVDSDETKFASIKNNNSTNLPSLLGSDDQYRNTFVDAKLQIGSSSDSNTSFEDLMTELKDGVNEIVGSVSQDLKDFGGKLSNFVTKNISIAKIRSPNITNNKRFKNLSTLIKNNLHGKLSRETVRDRLPENLNISSSNNSSVSESQSIVTENCSSEILSSTTSECSSEYAASSIVLGENECMKVTTNNLTSIIEEGEPSNSITDSDSIVLSSGDLEDVDLNNDKFSEILTNEDVKTLEQDCVNTMIKLNDSSDNIINDLSTEHSTVVLNETDPKIATNNNLDENVNNSNVENSSVVLNNDWELGLSVTELVSQVEKVINNNSSKTLDVVDTVDSNAVAPSDLIQSDLSVPPPNFVLPDLTKPPPSLQFNEVSLTKLKDLNSPSIPKRKQKKSKVSNKNPQSSKKKFSNKSVFNTSKGPIVEENYADIPLNKLPVIDISKPPKLSLPASRKITKTNYTFDLTLLNGEKVSIGSAVAVPPLRQIQTLGDGHCMYHALTGGIGNVVTIKNFLLSALSKFTLTSHLKQSLTDEFTENVWGSSDGLHFYAKAFNVNVLEILPSQHFSVLHVPDNHCEDYIYIMYSNFHFSACIPYDSIYKLQKLIEENSYITELRTIYNAFSNKVNFNPFISISGLEHYEGTVLHYNYLSTIFQELQFPVVSVRVRKENLPYVLVLYIRDKLQYDKDRLENIQISLTLHVEQCKNCISNTGEYWTHHNTEPIIVTNCSEMKLAVSDSDMKDKTDWIIEFFPSDFPLHISGSLVTNRVGRVISVAQPSLVRSSDFVTSLVAKSLIPFKTAIHRTAFVMGEILSDTSIMSGVMQVFDSVYHNPIVNQDTYFSDYRYNAISPINSPSLMFNATSEYCALVRCTTVAIINQGIERLNEVEARSTTDLSSIKDTSVKVYSVNFRRWILPPPKGKMYRYCFLFRPTDKRHLLVSLKDFYDPNTQESFLAELHSVRVNMFIVYKGTEVLLEPILYKSIQSMLITPALLNHFNVQIVRGVPGAGKTHYILNNMDLSATLDDIMLTATRNAAIDARNRVLSRGSISGWSKEFLQKKFATVEAALLNADRYPTGVKTIYFDEAFLKHFGQLIYVAIKLKALKLIFIGDEAQIPYQDRNGFALKYSSAKALIDLIPSSNVTFLSISYRIPQDVVYALNQILKTDQGLPVYPSPISSTNHLINSVSYEIACDYSAIINQYDHVLTFVQHDKNFILEKFPKISVNTINEYQGQQAKRILLLRLQSTDNTIYCNPAQLLTAISRHTEQFKYITPVSDTLVKILDLMMSHKYPRNVGGGYVYNSARTESVVQNKINPRLEGSELGPDRRLELVAPYAINLNNEDPILTSIVSSNNESGFRGTFVVSKEIPYEKKPRSIPIEVPLDADKDHWRVLQYYMDDIRPGSSLRPNRFLMENFENTELVISCLNWELRPVRNLPKHRDTLTPALRTSCLPPFRKSQKAILKGYNERNGVVQNFATAIFDDSVIELSIESFCLTYFTHTVSEIKSIFTSSPLTINVDSLTKWLNTQPPGVYEELKSLDSHYLIEHITSKYSYMLKSVSKPKLEEHPEKDFSSPQCIAYLPKLINAIYCPIIQEMKRRVQFVLRQDKIIFTDMSVLVFEEIMSARVGYSVFSKIKRKFEIDFSKYDKSQHLWALTFETEMMKLFGVREDLVKLWILVHKSTMLIAHEYGFRAFVDYQRKSGDAMTFFGNTLWLMYMLMMLVGEERMRDSFGLFGGDDSLLFLFNDIPESEIYSLFENSSAKFSMEMKIINVNSFYFCSRFLIYYPADDRWYVVPDPLKALIKLGRSDLVNYVHVNEYRISLHDNWVNYSNILLHNSISANFSDRYHYDEDISPLLSALWNVVSSEKLFAEGYYWHDCDEETLYSTLPKLDM
ncbi:RdRp [Wuhan heteroptera virus 1]|uniref:RdRp n=1 Tax=Wuhan heteroptera virus 1 TaxID=1923701 RepID=UPI0009096AE5|nr:RdRp [Wuhan heteroptera virus 1]APG77532.1 RdRp [Wuhan heteroptera virus 1]APG77787.1 RdRp [Wuhan heteroptera virus 1]